MPPPTERAALVAELAAIAQSLRGYCEVAGDSGAEGLPRTPRSVPQPSASHAGASPAAVDRATAVASTDHARQAPHAEGAGGARIGTAPAPVAQAAEHVPAPAATAPAIAAAAANVQPPRADAALSPAERARRLEVLAAEVASCTRCPLHAERTQTVFARGSAAAELVFVGEGPGADEDAQGFPFVGKAGQLLDRMIQAMGYQRDDVYICNIVKCRPPNNRKPTPEEMGACAPYLRTQLEVLAPRAIVALGATAVEGLLGSSIGITRMRGSWKLYQGRVPVMPTFHPAYLLRSPEKKREVWTDLQLVMKRLGKEVTRPAR